MDKKQNFTLLETVFSVMIAVAAFFPNGHAVDRSHAAMVALLRITVAGVALIGLLTVFLMKRRLPKDGVNSTGGPGSILTVTQLIGIPSGDTVEWNVNDRTMRADALRCNLYVLTHRSQTALPLLLLPVVISCIIALPIGLSHPVAGIWVASVVFGGWFLFLSVLIYFDLLKRYPRPDSERLCTTTLTQMGFEDVTPNGSTFVPWNQVTDIIEKWGDLYLWRVGGKGNFITRNAFQNALEAREFQRRAMELWKNPAPLPMGTITTPSAAYQSNVWPPPPQA